MNKEEVITIIDGRIDQRVGEFERYVAVLAEQIHADNKMTYELLGGKIDNLEKRFDKLEEKVDSIQEMVAQNTEDIARNTEDISKNTEDITSLKTMVNQNTKDITKIKNKLDVE